MSKWRLFSTRKERGRAITRLMARDGENCTICGGRLDRTLRDPSDPQYITFDHIVAQSAGGTSVETNLRLTHQRCNNERGNDPVQEGDADHG